ERHRGERQSDRARNAAVSAEKERRKPEREHARAGEVERVPAMLDVLVQGDDEERRGRDPCRDVDEEDPPPGEGLDDDPAEERTGTVEVSRYAVKTQD